MCFRASINDSAAVCCGVRSTAGGLLTQLCDAAHPGGEQRLFQRAQLSLGISLTLAAPP